MILFINASPKLKNSNSKYFCDLLGLKSKTCYIYNDNFKHIKNSIKKFNTIIFAFPTYLDIVPSKLIEFIEYYKSNYKNKNIYIICNCGFLETYHNKLSIEFMKNYVTSKGGIFKGYLNIGSGEVLKLNKSIKLIKLISINFYIKMKIFKKAVNKNKEIYLNTKINFFTKKLYCLICNKFWKKKLN